MENQIVRVLFYQYINPLTCPGIQFVRHQKFEWKYTIRDLFGELGYNQITRNFMDFGLRGNSLKLKNDRIK